MSWVPVEPVEPVVMISAIEHHLYCPRQCALIHVDGVWLDNEHTVRGQYGHRRADSGESRLERGRRVLRSIPLFSERLGLSGRADIIEQGPDGSFVPVEYKIGSLHGDAAEFQLCAQALCLEEMSGRAVSEGALWLSGPRRRLKVSIDAELRARTIAAIVEIRDALISGALPRALYDARCGACQFIDYCQPEVCSDARRIAAYMEQVFACGT
jgi:CRISPR-associated exonuclease Cas4